MALTKTKRRDFVIGDRRMNIYEVDFDNSYPTGGEALSKADLNVDLELDFVLAISNSGYSFEYDETNEKLLAYWADYDAVADGALIEVADTTNLSAVTNVLVVTVGKSL